MPLAEIADFSLSMTLWDHYLAGDILERTALMAESRPDKPTPEHGPMWDRDLRWLASVKVDRESASDRPDWWWHALPWVAEAVAFGELPYPESVGS